ncbi:MAG TPA: ribonuclease H [Kofleriaceae bacterium]|nr:ribonuclease H [Kofleriaceae bacterium]
MRVDANGNPVAAADGRVDVAYKAVPGAKLYRAAVRNLDPTGDPADETPVALEIDPAPTSEGAAAAERAPDPIIVYTDGGATPNPGPCGIGVVILDRGERREISEYLGEGTNNIAELTAVLRGLEAIAPAERARPVLLHTDSEYSIGVLTLNWKPKKNIELIAALRELMGHFPRLRLVKVPAHSGVPENERCDQLATLAVTRRGDGH